MKRHLIICALLAATFQAAIAQKPDTAQVLVHYKFTHVRDTFSRANPYTENMVLFVGKAAGSYRSYDTQVQNELYRKQFQEKITNSPDGRIRLDRKVTGTGAVYNQFINDKKLVRKEMLGMDPYIITNPLPVISWRISNNTAILGDLRCQKATCHFKGRDYTAWFCPDLPVRVGPWKLNGLPGVIVEAYDSKKEVIFKFDRVEKAVFGARKPIRDRAGRVMALLGDDDGDADPDIIQVPDRGIKTTDKEFERLQTAIRKDANAFSQAIGGGQGDGPKIDRKRGAAPVVNNPIELPEKK